MALKMYFPQVLDWIDIDTNMGCDLLERWPTLQQLQHAHQGTLRKSTREQALAIPLQLIAVEGHR